MRKIAVLLTVMVLTFAAAPARADGLEGVEAAAPAAAPAAKAPAELECKSPSCVLMDYLTGEILYEKNPDEKRAPASLTKIMTLVVALEAVAEGKVKMDDPVTASEEACSLGGSQVWTEPGETHSLKEWLTCVAVGSANDASMVVAEYVAGSEAAFVALMNRKAREIGMTGSEFKNSHGLDEEGHMVTPRDMAILGRYAVKVPGLLDLTKIYRTTFREGKFGLDNANKMLVYFNGCDGLKTGSTDKAGYCVANTAERDGKRFISVAMGATDSNTRFSDSTRMLNYAFANYHPMLLVKKGEPEQKVRVWKGSEEFVEAVPETDLAVVVRKGEQQGITHKIDLRAEFMAPLKKGDRLGEIVFIRNGSPIARVNLVAAADVQKKGFFGHLVTVVKGLMTF